MGGILAGTRPIDSGSVSSPGLPFTASPQNGIYMPASGGFGIALTNKKYFDLSPGGVEIGSYGTPDGILTGLAASPVAVSGATSAMGVEVHPSGNFVYMASLGASTVYSFSRNSITGELSFIGSVVVGLVRRIQVSPNGKFLYAANYGDGTISICAIAINGTLTVSSTYTAPANPYYIRISPSGTFMLLTNAASTVYILSVSTTTGSLLYAGGAGSSLVLSGSNAAQIAISPDSTRAYIPTNTNTIAGINIAAGLLTSMGTQFPTGGAYQAIDLSVMTDGLSLVAACASTSAAITIFSINATSGALALLWQKAIPSGTLNMLSKSSDSRYIYASNVSTVYAYSRDNLTGNLTQLSTYTAAMSGLGMAISPLNAHLYCSNNSQIVEVATSTTNLMPIVTSTFDPSSNLSSVFNINSTLRVLGAPVLDIAGADIRYSKLAGLNTQAFSASSLKVSEVANGKQGIATLAAGTVTVNNTGVTANSRIILTPQETGLFTGSLRVSARVVGTSFTILSTVATDTCTVAYEIFEPG